MFHMFTLVAPPGPKQTDMVQTDQSQDDFQILNSLTSVNERKHDGNLLFLLTLTLKYDVSVSRLTLG